MNKVIITENMYERSIDENNVFEMRGYDWLSIIADPVLTDEKNSCTYMFPFVMDGPQTLKRYATHLSVLILDVDYGCRVDEFDCDWEYYLYTTHSHTETHNKFRVIIPMDRPIPMSVYDTKWFRDFIMEMFPFNDVATIKYQGFYLPNAVSMEAYEFRSSMGPLFSLKSFKDDLKKRKKRHDLSMMVKADIRKRKNETISLKRKTTVINNGKVRAYLDSPVSLTGMGHLSYVAICVCNVANDMETLDKVMMKMMHDGFSDLEIQRSIDNSRR